MDNFLSSIMTFDSTNPAIYPKGSVVIYNDVLYNVLATSPTGIPGSSPNFQPVLAGVTGTLDPNTPVFQVGPAGSATGANVPVYPSQGVSFNTRTLSMSVATGATGAVVSINTPPPAPGSTGTYGTFVGFSTQSLSGGSQSKGIIAPVTNVTTISNPADFTVLPSGEVQVNRAGTYQATGKVQIQNSSLGQGFALQVNQGGSLVSYYNGLSMAPNNSAGSVTTMLQLQAGDKVSMGFLSGGPITLATQPGGMNEGSPSVAITLTKLDNDASMLVGPPGPRGATGPAGGPMGPTGPTGAAGSIAAPTGVTGAAPPALSAAQYAMRTGADTYNDGNYLPYQTLITQPGDGSIQMMDRTLAIRDSGNYQINISLTSNGTTNIPNIHAIIDDYSGKNKAALTRDIDIINVLNNGMTSTSLIIPISGPGNVRFQVQGANAQVKVPANQPQGQLSIIKIS
jgi:hypothetical protein